MFSLRGELTRIAHYLQALQDVAGSARIGRQFQAGCPRGRLVQLSRILSLARSGRGGTVRRAHDQLSLQFRLMLCPQAQCACVT